ncbi:hypothetical protein L3Y34_019611 [Caenorhabditis briggsae]|uniref:Uncharacterized protein n=1 Tax=Caenorhabditis briggsae TaxID=6238 RepID=A0AAE9DQ99_CAEBR|nr:hypothetical protein L3Y34_019611 [Caenorhabditis briggsae]
MTENQNLYSGFFLQSSSENENGDNSIRVACFKPGTTFRKVLELTTKSPCKLKMGETVDFSSLDGELTDKSRIQLKDNQEPLYHVDTGAVNDIWYFIQNHQVNSEDIRPLNILHHSFLGEINSDDFSLSPAR